MPNTYALKSTTEFIDIVRSKQPQGKIASLDVTNLFTNVPIEQTIAVLCDNAYRHPDLPPPAIPETVMAAMLRLCTTKAPFRCPRGNLYYQCDGVAMGSPLGVLFAQAYMSWVEGKALHDDKPHMYCRYIDDILVEVSDRDALIALKTRLEAESCLTFTVEESDKNRINFLDVSIDASSNTYVTSVFRKPTDPGKCLSGKSECPEH